MGREEGTPPWEREEDVYKRQELEDADYHTRKEDLHDPYKGYVLLPGQYAAPELIPPEAGESGELSEKNLYWLGQIMDLCQRRGIELWLIKAPSNLSLIHIFRSERLRVPHPHRVLLYHKIQPPPPVFSIPLAHHLPSRAEWC